MIDEVKEPVPFDNEVTKFITVWLQPTVIRYIGHPETHPPLDSLLKHWICGG
jgi:hypothetical protein